MRLTTTSTKPSRVVIIGAGFGGLAAARELAGKPVEVTLIDQHNFHTFQPLLYEVATAGLDPADVAYPIRAVIGKLPNVRFRLGTVTGIDWGQRNVILENAKSDFRSGGFSPLAVQPFDYLIVASGAIVNYFSVTEAANHAMPLYTLEDARRLRDHILRRFEEADDAGVDSSDGTLTFLVVGGGPTGVEVAGAISELLDMSKKHDGFRFDRSQARVVLTDGLEHVLSAFNKTAQRYAEATLKGRAVELLLNTKVSRISATGATLSDGTVIPSKTVVWAGGVTVNGTPAGFVGSSTTTGGRLHVNSNLSVVDKFGVFAIGDAAAIPTGPGSPDTCPQLAQVAMQSGHHAACQIMAQVAGAPMIPFRYRDRGIMATVGRRAAIAQLGAGFVLRGTLGWVAWFGLHLVYLVGVRNKLTVFINWTWRYLNWTSGPRIIVDDQRDTAPEDRATITPLQGYWTHQPGYRRGRPASQSATVQEKLINQPI
jgi:NADH:ubiquinone reductase (H+-translocating)